MHAHYEVKIPVVLDDDNLMSLVAVLMAAGEIADESAVARWEGPLVLQALLPAARCIWCQAAEEQACSPR